MPKSSASREALIDPFSREEVERAGRYHRPLYLAGFVDGVLSLAVLGIVAFGPLGDAAARWLDRVPWWAATVAWTWFALGAGFVFGLPISFWRGYVRERRWGFSTQRLGGWIGDRLKGLATGWLLAGVAMLGFVGLARWLPRAWPLPVAPAGAGLVTLLSFVAPLILEPVFNRFAPLKDPALAAELHELSRAAGVPVRGVLVADASRRTRKQNAYVSGLGPTRRVVLFDTLVDRADPAQVRLVVAHELGHRRFHHVAKGSALSIGAMVAAVACLWLLLGWDAALRTAGATSAGDPRVVPFVLFAVAGFSVLAGPLASALSRRWETVADRFSLELTGDLPAFERSHRELALANLSDLDPPRAVYLVGFSHPTPPERIARAREWAAGRAG